MRIRESRFADSLRLGLGRAILQARREDVSAYRDLILDGCLHCRAYDPQVEGTRHQYMFDLLRCLPEGEQRFLIDGVLGALGAEADEWDTAQRFGIAMLLAKDGDAEARRAMYAAYREASWQVDECFVELDGIAGFLFVAERAGALPDPDDVHRSAFDFFERSCELCGEAALRAAFEKAALEKPAIAAFRRAVEGWDPPKHERPLRPTDEELLEMARSFPELQDPKEIVARLRLFWRRPFPLDAGMLLGLLDHADERVRNAALARLERVRDPRVRALAFEAKYRERAAHLLVENYQPGDEALLAKWIREATDPEDRHGLQLGALSFFEAHPHREVEIPVWELLYESGDCGFCRGSVVRRLIEIDALRDDLRAECAWDAVPENRKSVT